jgi:hypothetical protein
MSKKTAMSKVVQLAIQKLHSEAKAIVDCISAERDKLRDLVQEYQEILDSIDQAEEGFENALESLSQLL